MEAIFQKHKEYFRQMDFIWSVLSGFLFLALSLVINYTAGVYADKRASNAVTDIVLNNIPVFNVGWIFIYGSFALFTGIAVLMLSEPRWLPFTIKSIALFTVIRSFFITLTHLAPFPSQVLVASNFFLDKLTFGGDLFFSGHTGVPFLMALIFWNFRRLRVAFIITSLIFGASVLLGHLHYSIDVFAAYFITYAIFHICRTTFSKDYKLFQNGTYQTA